MDFKFKLIQYKMNNIVSNGSLRSTIEVVLAGGRLLILYDLKRHFLLPRCDLPPAKPAGPVLTVRSGFGDEGARVWVAATSRFRSERPQKPDSNH